MSEQAQKFDGIATYTKRAAMERQIEILRGDKNAKVWFRGYPDQEGAGADKFFGSITDALPWIKEQEALHRAVGIVVGEGGNKNGEITNTDWLYIDQDGDGALLAETRFHVPPDFIVERDEQHFHAFWRVSDCRVQDFREAQKRLIEYYGADRSKHSAAGVMRLAGSKHQKDAKHSTRLALIDNSANIEHCGIGYELSELMASLPELPPRDEQEESEHKGARVESAVLREALSYPDPSIPYDKGWRDLIAGIGCTNCPESRDIAHEFSEGKLDRQKRGEPANYHGPGPVDLILDTMKPMEGGVGTGTVAKTCRDAGWPGTFAPRQSASEAFGAAISNMTQPEETVPLKGVIDDVEPASEDDLAITFANNYSERFKFVPELGEWRAFTGQQWSAVTAPQIWNLTLPIARSVAKQFKQDSTRRKITSRSTVANTEALLRGNGRIVTPIIRWDSDPWLLNAKGKIVELRTGKSRDIEATDYFMKSTAVAPLPEGANLREACPQWFKFLDEITAGDGRLQSFMQRRFGYSLTGLTIEQVMFFLYGTGGNGKGTELNTETRILGDYAAVAPLGMFTATKQDRHPTDMAMLHGARLVSGQEVEKGQYWAEAKIKTLTGGDPITARFMNKNFFTYDPQFKLALSGNDKPRLSIVDEAIRRRIIMVPYLVTIKNKDVKLPGKLIGEWPGILRWGIDGCLEWQKQGLNLPDSVTRATDAYFTEQDLFAGWLKERCDTGTGWASIAELHDSYRAYFHDETGEDPPEGRRGFSQLLEGHKFAPKRGTDRNRTKGFANITLKPAGGGSRNNIADEEGEELG